MNQQTRESPNEPEKKKTMQENQKTFLKNLLISICLLRVEIASYLVILF